MAEPLTPVERKVYHYLLDFLAENTYQPSIREIGRKFRIKSTKTVSDLLQSLCAKGYIERDPSRSRGVRLVGYGGPTRVQPLPFYDRVNADGPVVGPELQPGRIGFDRRFVPGDDAFVLRMRGDAMRGHGILDGDFVVVSPSTASHGGDVVAVRLGDQVALRSADGIDAANAALSAADAIEAVAVEPAVAVIGVVTGVFRSTFDRDAFEGAIAT